MRFAATLVLLLASSCVSLAHLDDGDAVARASSSDAAITDEGGQSGGDGAGSDGERGAEDSSAADGPAPTSRVIFVTSESFSGNLGGLAGADAKCQALAAAALLGGTFRALVATAGSPTSLTSRVTQSTVPYRLPNGAFVAASWSALASVNLLGPINVTETRLPSPVRPVWTNTGIFGNAREADCNAWTLAFPSGSGRTARTDRATLDSPDLTPCDTLAALYCIEQ